MRRPRTKRKCKHCQTFLILTHAASGANVTVPSPRAARPARLPANVAGSTSPLTAITSQVLPRSSASGSGARPTQPTGDVRALGPPMRYKRT